MSNKKKRGGRQRGPDAKITSSYVYTDILNHLKKHILERQDVTFSKVVNTALASYIDDDELRSEFAAKLGSEGTMSEYFDKYACVLDQKDFGFLSHFAAAGHQNTIELIRYKRLELQDANTTLDNALKFGLSFEDAKSLADCIRYYEQDIARLEKEVDAFDNYTLPEDSFLDRVMSALVHEMQWVRDKATADIRRKTGLPPDDTLGDEDLGR